MKCALSFCLLLAAWSVGHAGSRTYHRTSDYIHANQNEPATLETEIRASSFWNECLLNLDLPANTPRPFQPEVKVLPDGDFVLTTPDDLTTKRNEVSWSFEAMLRTYVSSRALGMTPALSKERTWLIHGTKGFKHSLRKGGRDLALIEKELGLPADRLQPTDDIGWLLEMSDSFECYLLPDGDLTMIVLVDAKDGSFVNLIPVDSRLLRNPGLAAWLGTQKKTVADRLRDMENALDTPARQIISLELKMYWKALRAVVEEHHFKAIPFDTIDFRIGVQMK